MIIILTNLVQSLFSGFQITVIVLFFLKLLFRKHDLLWRNLFMLSNCILLFASLICGLNYFIELFSAWYSQVVYEQQMFKSRVMGPYWYWIMSLLPFIVPQIFWLKKARRSYLTSLIVALFLSPGYFIEITTILFSNYGDYLPSSRTYYAPAFLEIAIPFLIFSIVLLAVYFVRRNRKYAT